MARFVIKRNNERVGFDREKIVNAIFKALSDVHSEAEDAYNLKEANAFADDVVHKIEETNKDEITVEEIQDIVESILMEKDKAVAKSYILFRHNRAEIRSAKARLGIQEDNLKLPLNSITVLAARYLLKNPEGKIIESPRQLFMRVSHAIASVEKEYGKSDAEVAKIEQEFYEAMTSFKFMPNSPTLMNAGTALGQLSACFVLPVGDSIIEIFDAVKYAAMIHQSGGGTGFAFSRLRPHSDIVKSTGGVASGPVSFMKVFDAATEQIKQGGKRRGANMGILRIDHPDILDFIVVKEDEGVLRNFNISVGITDTFMKAVKQNTDYALINPRNGEVVRYLNARAVWNLIVTMAWKTGDPGLVFLDRMNSTFSNPVPKFGPIEATNPCGEQPLYPYDSCNLGSINLAKMVKRTDHHFDVDWDELKRIVYLGVRFLDNVIDANNYPLKQIEEVSKAIRRIGLGVMGWADMLIKLGIRYDSNEALLLAEEVMSFISKTGRKASEELAAEKGEFPEFKNSIWRNLGYKPLRNSTVTTIAPTGTISIISGGTSQGIEPIFSVVYMRNVQESLGSNLIEVNNEFERLSLEHNFYTEELMQKLAGKTTIQDVEEVPESVRRLFVTSFDVSPEWHVKMQAAFQKYVDNAVSKTINLPSTATPQDVESAYLLAYDLGCKGITIYRDQSKSVQVLQPISRQQTVGSTNNIARLKQNHDEKQEKKVMTISEIKSGASSYVIIPEKEVKCPDCGTPMISGGGCFTCPKCGYSVCGD
ncbi:MAG: adenosylcobalamin-dependent ribonucleoside-diphosphate reductase [Candidatus Micrarchaeaceae archaeon]